MGRWAAGLATVFLAAACASKRDAVADLEGFRLLQEALRAGDAPAVFGMLAPQARKEWLAENAGADDPLEQWARHLQDPATGWPQLASAEIVSAGRPDPDTTDLTLRLPDGQEGTLRLRHTAAGWFLLSWPHHYGAR